MFIKYVHLNKPVQFLRITAIDVSLFLFSILGYEWKYKRRDICKWWNSDETTLNQEYESSEKGDIEINIRLGEQDEWSPNGKFFRS